MLCGPERSECYCFDAGCSQLRNERDFDRNYRTDLSLTFFILRASTKLVSVLGETGNNVMMRLMGLILMVIAVECFVSGLKPILVDIVREGMVGVLK